MAHRVANLAFLKPDFENLFFYVFDFFEVFGFISNIKKVRRNLAFYGLFSEQYCTNLLVKAMWPTNRLCNVTVALRNSGSLLVYSCRSHVL